MQKIAPNVVSLSELFGRADALARQTSLGLYNREQRNAAQEFNVLVGGHVVDCTCVVCAAFTLLDESLLSHSCSLFSLYFAAVKRGKDYPLTDDDMFLLAAMGAMELERQLHKLDLDEARRLQAALDDTTAPQPDNVYAEVATGPRHPVDISNQRDVGTSTYHDGLDLLKPITLDAVCQTPRRRAAPMELLERYGTCHLSSRPVIVGVLNLYCQTTSDASSFSPCRVR